MPSPYERSNGWHIYGAEIVSAERERAILWQDTFRKLCTITRDGRSEDAVQASMESWQLFANNYRAMCRDDYRRN